ncbi:unnamed protein product [Moneuplotes crassus]|uniref:Fungal lipase-type domain-containing protein n=1 Tax=Euplotes crassus TaxID=5936 RepID=A0AAD1UUE2_EUPCR|nr:unnamed protein product [Moneuplotes crassus]
MKILLLIVMITVFVSCDYSEELAVDMLYASALSYCPTERVLAGNCKAAGDATEKAGILPFFSLDNQDSKNPIYMTLMKRESQKQIIVGFSGTKGAEELIDEIAQIVPKEYDIHPDKGVKVFAFFYEHYKNQFRSSFLEQMTDILSKEENTGYDVIFTGHSLGGSLTMHAAADAILNGILNNTDVYIYTFGQPRVGNIQFIEEFFPNVKECYRVIHNNDIVPHLPPCINELGHGCVKHGFLLPAFPYHAATEVLYEKDFESYKVCSSTEGEDKHCSLSKIGKSILDHLTYFGVEVGQFYRHDSEVPKSISTTLLI